jgi:hypothetical protein
MTNTPEREKATSILDIQTWMTGLLPNRSNRLTSLRRMSAGDLDQLRAAVTKSQEKLATAIYREREEGFEASDTAPEGFVARPGERLQANSKKGPL